MVEFENLIKIEWTYSASGAKLRKTVYADGALSYTKDYTGGFVYSNSLPDFFNTQEGRVVNNDGQYEYQYFLKDHLGNVRAAIACDVTSGGLVHKQVNQYYPFGLELADIGMTTDNDNRFKYNAKELEDDHNLYWYHYGARYYDPQIGRWHTVDPVDEFNSPYCYVGNKVIISIDPDGMNELTFNKEGAFTGYIEDNNYWDLVTGSIEGREKKFTFNDFDKGDQDIAEWGQDLINEFENAGLKIPEIFYIDINFESRVAAMALDGIANVVPKIPGFEGAGAISAAIASRSNGPMDYGAKSELSQNRFAFFLSGDKAYNVFDAGNYVWGYSMKLLNWSLPEARIGAHINEFRKRLEFDTPGDQRAISNGYNYKP